MSINVAKKVCQKSTGFSSERKKKNTTVLPKITGRMKVVSYELGFDKSYWADGSCEAEHSKNWNGEKSQECSERAGPPLTEIY